MPDSDEFALICRDVTKTFRGGGRTVDALHNLSLKIRCGKISGLIGPDGAGKTTLMRLAAGLLRPNSGTVSVFGIDTLQRPVQAQANIGYMPQRFGLYEDLTVQENLDLYADLQGRRSKRGRRVTRN